MTDDDIREFLLATGASDNPDLSRIRDIGDGTYVWAKPLLFHWTVISGYWHDLVGYNDRWCFENEQLAMAALEQWPDRPAPDYEPAGWHRHPKTGRRRPSADAELEYVDP